MKSFCPSCGKNESEIQFVDGFCIDCYLKDHDLFKIPKTIELEVCTNCQKFRLGKQWSDYTEENIKKFILSRAEPDMDVEGIELTIYPEEKKVKIILQINGKKNGIKLKFKKEIYLKEKKVTCPACSRLNGNYFEATVQVRFSKMTEGKERNALVKIHEILAARRESGDNLAQIVNLEERKDGFDLRLGSKKAARKVVRELIKKDDAKLTASKTLITEKKGEQIFRDTFCVRLP